MRTLALALVALATTSCIDRRDYAVASSADADVDAPPKVESTITVTVIGPGHVGGDRRGIDCPSLCVATYPPDGTLTLTATPDSGAVFKEWQGDCTGDGACVLDLATSHEVTASFSPPAPQQNLQVLMSGSGSGTVRSVPPGLTCISGTCNAGFPEGSTVQLVATADPGSGFVDWGGTCAGVSGPVCNVTMSGARTVIANFDPVAVITLRVADQGTVVAQVPPLAGPTTCTHATDPCTLTYRLGTAVSFVATPAAGYYFDSFVSVVCQASPSNCAFTVTGPDQVDAYFCPTGTC